MHDACFWSPEAGSTAAHHCLCSCYTFRALRNHLYSRKMDLDYYLQRNSQIMTDLASDGAARTALDSRVVTDSSCDPAARPPWVSRGAPTRQPLTEQKRSNNVAACRATSTTKGTAKRQGAAHGPSAPPVADRTVSRPTSASVSGIIKQVLLRVDQDDITAALDGLEHRRSKPLLPGDAGRPASCATGESKVCLAARLPHSAEDRMAHLWRKAVSVVTVALDLSLLVATRSPSTPASAACPFCLVHEICKPEFPD